MRLYRITSLWKWTRKNDNVEKERVVMEQIELVKILLKKTHLIKQDIDIINVK